MNSDTKLVKPRAKIGDVIVVREYNDEGNKRYRQTVVREAIQRSEIKSERGSWGYWIDCDSKMGEYRQGIPFKTRINECEILANLTTNESFSTLDV